MFLFEIQPLFLANHQGITPLGFPDKILIYSSTPVFTEIIGRRPRRRSSLKFEWQTAGGDPPPQLRHLYRWLLFIWFKENAQNSYVGHIK
jgi:hypothetical protein